MTRTLTSIYLTLLSVLTGRYEYQDYFENTFRKLISNASFMDLLNGSISSLYLLTSFQKSCELLCEFIRISNAKDYVLSRQVEAIYLAEGFAPEYACHTLPAFSPSQKRTVRQVPFPRHISTWSKTVERRSQRTSDDKARSNVKNPLGVKNSLVKAARSTSTIKALRAKFRALQSANFVSMGYLQPILGMLTLDSPLSKQPRSVCEAESRSQIRDAMHDHSARTIEEHDQGGATTC